MQQISKKRKPSDQEGVDHLSNLPAVLLNLVTAHLEPADRAELRKTNRLWHGDVTGEELFWTAPELVDQLFEYYECTYFHFHAGYDIGDGDGGKNAKNALREIIKDARRWAKDHPDVEVVVAFTDRKGKGQCYVCDVGGTMAGDCYGIDRASCTNSRSRCDMLCFGQVFTGGRIRRPRLRRLGSNVTVRTQLCVLPSTSGPPNYVKKVLGLHGFAVIDPAEQVADTARGYDVCKRTFKSIF